MARGESEAKNGNGAAVAIWAVFGVACLAVAWVVVRVSVEPEAPEDPFGMGEPHPGIEGPLRSLSVRGCRLTEGPRLAAGASAGPDDVTRHLTRRGYVSAAPFGEPHPLPLNVAADELRGTCGVVASVVEPGGYLERARAGGETTLPCDANVVLTPICDGGTVTFDGHGEARVGIFAMPGIVEHDELPADVVLAHAEAVAILGAAGWTPVVEAMKAGQTAGTLDALPEHPRGGCVPYVVAGLGLGHASTTWLGRGVSQGRAPDRFLAGVVVCEHGRHTELTGAVEPGAVPLLVARPYRMSGGPTAPAARAAVPLTLLAPGDELPMPPSLRDHGAP